MRSRIVVGMVGVVMAMSAGALGGCGTGGGVGVRTTEELAPSWNGDVDRNGALDEAEDAAAGHSSQECRAVLDAFAVVVSGGGEPFRVSDAPGTDDGAARDAETAAMLTAVPPDLRDELEVIRVAFEASVRAFAALGSEGLLDPARQSERKEAQAILEAPDAQLAADTVEVYLRSCPSL